MADRHDPRLPWSRQANHSGEQGPVQAPRPEFEYRTVTLPPTTSAAAAREQLTEAAEYGRWELARTVLYAGGRREILLRRRIIRVRATL